MHTIFFPWCPEKDHGRVELRPPHVKCSTTQRCNVVGWWNLWVCLCASVCRQAVEIKPCVHLILWESNYCRITLSFAIRGDNRAALIYTTQSSCSVCCYTFLPGGKWSSSERWLTLFCPCFLILQIGLSQHLVCWRLSYICNTVVLVAGNLGYLVYPYELLYCAEQGHFRLYFCLLSI